MGISGSVTSAVSSTSVTLPIAKLQIIGAYCYNGSAAGYLSIPIDSTKNALFPFSQPIGVTTVDQPVVQPTGKIMWHFNFVTTGTTLNYTGTGLTSGTFVFYYGTPFSDSVPLAQFAAIAVSFTTGTSLSFTFPGGPVRLNGIVVVLGVSNVQTNQSVTETWNTATGKSILVAFSQAETLAILPLGPDPTDNQAGLSAATTLTVTQAFNGTHVGTGYAIIFYTL